MLPIKVHPKIMTVVHEEAGTFSYKRHDKLRIKMRVSSRLNDVIAHTKRQTNDSQLLLFGGAMHLTKDTCIILVSKFKMITDVVGENI